MSNNNSALTQPRLSPEDSDAFEDALISAYSKKAAAMRRGEIDIFGRELREREAEAVRDGAVGGKVSAHDEGPKGGGKNVQKVFVHPADPTTFDPGTARDRSYRAKLIATGAILPLASRPTLRADDRGRRVAERHIASGEQGRKVVPTGPGFFELPAWHVRALELRERRPVRVIESWHLDAAGIVAHHTLHLTRAP